MPTAVKGLISICTAGGMGVAAIIASELSSIPNGFLEQLKENNQELIIKKFNAASTNTLLHKPGLLQITLG